VEGARDENQAGQPARSRAIGLGGETGKKKKEQSWEKFVSYWAAVMWISNVQKRLVGMNVDPRESPVFERNGKEGDRERNWR